MRLICKDFSISLPFQIGGSVVVFFAVTSVERGVLFIELPANSPRDVGQVVRDGHFLHRFGGSARWKSPVLSGQQRTEAHCTVCISIVRRGVVTMPRQQQLIESQAFIRSPLSGKMASSSPHLTSPPGLVAPQTTWFQGGIRSAPLCSARYLSCGWINKGGSDRDR